MSKFPGGMVGSVSNTPSGTAYTGKANGIWSLPHHIAAKSALQWAIGQTKPNPPTIGSATAISSSSVSVAFIPPVQDGGSTITIYTVTSSGGQTATGSSSPIVVTGLTAGTNYTFTVTATNNLGTSISSGTSNSTSPISNDAYFNSVSLLLNGDTITDLSNTPKVITNTGPVTINTTTKQFGTGSMSFNGSTSYLSMPVTASTVINGSENFTIEAWLYPTSATTYHCIYSGQWAIQVYMNVSRKIELAMSTSASSGSYITTQQSTGTLTLNQWTHVAVTRTGNNFTIFLNGTLDSTYASAGGSIGTCTSTAVGCFNNNQYFFTGFIDDFRVTKGLARYTANFTPPVAAFIASGPTQADPYYSSVSLLLNGDGTNGSQVFTDLSSSPKTITANGNAQISTAQQRYGTGAMYFDGNGDYLSLSTSPYFNFGTGDFTIEVWIKTNTKVDYQSIFISGDIGLWMHTNSAGNFIYGAGSGDRLAGYGQVCDDAWHHIAITRASGTVRVFVDGVQKDTTSNTTAINLTNPITIGTYSSSRYYTGYMDDFRITKGVARYTTNFTPPSAAFLASNTNTVSPVDPIFSNVSLLLNGDTLTDSSSVPKTITNNGSVAVNTTTKKFGTGSLYFSGSSSYLSIPYSSAFNFTSGTFTFECWIYQLANGGTGHYILDQRNFPTGTGFSINGGIPTLMYAGMNEARGTTAIPLNTWTHVAISVLSGTARIYINGVQTFYGTGYTFPDVSGTNTPLWVGAPNSYSVFLNAYVDDLRITNGIARYTSDFVPPAQALPTS
jgi:hypothetical protein